MIRLMKKNYVNELLQNGMLENKKDQNMKDLAGALITSRIDELMKCSAVRNNQKVCDIFESITSLTGRDFLKSRCDQYCLDNLQSSSQDGSGGCKSLDEGCRTWLKNDSYKETWEVINQLIDQDYWHLLTHEDVETQVNCTNGFFRAKDNHLKSTSNMKIGQKAVGDSPECDNHGTDSGNHQKVADQNSWHRLHKNSDDQLDWANWVPYVLENHQYCKLKDWKVLYDHYINKKSFSDNPQFDMIFST